MVLPIKFGAGSSDGTPFETGETRSVVVTDEALDAVTGYEGDTVTYTATVLDSEANKLPETFVADLVINATEVVSDQVFDAAHYSQETGLLTLEWTVPAPVGELTTKLTWAEQLI